MLNLLVYHVTVGFKRLNSRETRYNSDRNLFPSCLISITYISHKIFTTLTLFSDVQSSKVFCKFGAEEVTWTCDRKKRNEDGKKYYIETFIICVRHQMLIE